MKDVRPGAAGGPAPEAGHIPSFPLFDWLRIAMAAVVVAGHFSLLPWENAPNLAVQVFFALSGWLIGSILLDTRADGLSLFYFNRTTRVWIPYLVTVVLLYGLSLVKGPVNGRWGEFLTYDLTFTHNLFSLTPTFRQAVAEMPLQGTGNHFWSIAAEEQFYLVAPLAILFLPGGRHPLPWAALAITLLFVLQQFSAIAFGVAAAALHARRPALFAQARWRLAVAAVLAATLPWLFTPDYPRAAPVFAICLVLLLARTGTRGPVGRFLGGVSYPLYLNHWIALIGISSLARRLGGNGHLWASGGMLVAFAIGAAAYWLVDRPVLARRRRWYSPRLGWALAGMSYLLVGTGIAIGVALHGNPLAAG